jgi:hypothetical protein
VKRYVRNSINLSWTKILLSSVTYCTSNIAHFVGYGIIKRYRLSGFSLEHYNLRNEQEIAKVTKAGRRIPLQNVGSRPLQDGNVPHSGGD